jgi:hypothetical protein
MKVKDFEQKILEIENIRLVIRANRNDEVGFINWDEPSDGNLRKNDWLHHRIEPLTRGFEVSVIDGTGNIVHGSTRLRTLRASYRDRWTLSLMPRDQLVA